MSIIDSMISETANGDRQHFIMVFICAVLGGLCKVLFGRHLSKKPRWIMIIRELVLQISLFIILAPIIHNITSIPKWGHYAAIWTCCYFSNHIIELLHDMLLKFTKQKDDFIK